MKRRIIRRRVISEMNRVKRFIGCLVVELLYKAHLLSEIQNHTLECAECCKLFPQGKEFKPSEELTHLEETFGEPDLKHYWRGPFCPECGDRKMRRIVREIRELRGER